MHDPQQAPIPQARLARSWRRYLRFWGPRADADVDDELRFHFEMRVRDYMSRGLAEPEARAAVIQRLGDVDRVRAECVAITSRRERRMVRAEVIDAFAQDVRFAFRTLGRQKGWTMAAVLTLALGIGANTAVFSVVNSLLLHPLPYPHADRLAIVFQEPTTGNSTGISITITPRPPVVRAWLAGARSFEAMEPYWTTSLTLEQKDQTPALVHAALVRPSISEFTGQHPLLGHMFTAADVAARNPVLLIGEGMWRTRFGADPHVIGQLLTLDAKPYAVIGVLPGALRLPFRTEAVTDVWLPLDVSNNAYGLSVVGRLRPGVSFASATRELDALESSLGDSKPGRGKFRAKIIAPSQMVSFRQSLVLLSGAVMLVLLIACANVAHLLLARAAARQRELAIRAAIGAGTARLIRQLLTESLVLAFAGCAGGLAIGALGLRAAIAIRPDSLTALSAASIDTTTLLVTIALSAITGIGFGTIGAIQSARHSTHESLKAGALTTSHARRQSRLRSLLVVSEMALSTTLLIGASLLVRSVIHLQTTDPGFEPHGLYALNMNLPADRYAAEPSRQAFYGQLLDRARALPGIDAATLASGAPPAFSFLVGGLQAEGDPPPPAGTTSFLRYNGVAPGYFRIMGIRLLEGTTFTDSTSNSRQLVVNEGFARKYWRGQSALGRRVRIIQVGGQGDWETIVGVVADASLGGLTDDRSEPILYLPLPASDRSPALIVRMKSGFDAVPGLRRIVASLDPHLPPAPVENVEDEMAKSTESPRFTMTLLAAFTVMAVVLAAIGLYGVMAYSVAQRTREIGIRIALGATRRTVANGIVSRGLILAAGGVVVGAGGAWWATRLLERMLYGVTRSDPVSFALATLILLATAALACVVPMNRAAAVDPLVTMRAE